MNFGQKRRKEKSKLSTKKKVIIAVAVILFLSIISAGGSDETDTTTTTSSETTTQKTTNEETTESINPNVQSLMEATQYNQKTCNKIYKTLKKCGIEEIPTLTFVSEGVDSKSFKVESSSYRGSGMIIVNKKGLYFFSWGSDTLYDAEKSDKTKNINDYTISPSDVTQYMVAAEDAITSLLKSPSTAEFPSKVWASDQWSVSTSDGIVTVSSYVDAQNSFGAMIRENFTVQYRISDGKGVYCMFGGKVYLDER